MNLYVVTGTTRGLGEALARAIAARADNRLVTLGRAASDAVNIHVDLADGAAVERACDELERRIAGKDFERAVLINNAGVIAPVGPLEKVDGAELSATSRSTSPRPSCSCAASSTPRARWGCAASSTAPRARRAAPSSAGARTAPPRRASTWPLASWRSRPRPAASRSRWRASPRA